MDVLLHEQGFTVTRPNASLHPFEYFGGDYKHKVIDFIAFCRKGAFSIH